MDFLEFQELLGMLQNGDESERVEAKNPQIKSAIAPLRPYLDFAMSLD
jgi:hypothetical protein